MLRFHNIISQTLTTDKNTLLCIGAGLGILPIIAAYLNRNFLIKPKGL